MGDRQGRRFIRHLDVPVTGGIPTVDVIDRESGRLVYRVQVVDEVGRNLDTHVTKMIDKAFKEIPGQAAQVIRRSPPSLGSQF